MGARRTSQNQPTYQPDPSRASLERSMRQGNRHTHEFRQSLLHAQIAAAIAGIVLLLIGLLTGLQGLIVSGGVLSTMIPGSIIAYRTARRYWAFRLDVSSEGFRIDRPEEEAEEYLFSEVADISISIIPFWSHELTLRFRDGHKLTLHAGWERLDYVYDLLALARPDLALHPRYADARIDAIVRSHALSRFGEVASRRLLAFVPPLLKTAFTAGVAAWIVGSMTFAVGVDLFFLSCWAWLGWGVSLEMILRRRQRRQLELDALRIRRDVIGERQWLAKMGRLSMVFGLVAAVVIAFSLKAYVASASRHTPDAAVSAKIVPDPSTAFVAH